MDKKTENTLDNIALAVMFVLAVVGIVRFAIDNKRQKAEQVNVETTFDPNAPGDFQHQTYLEEIHGQKNE